MAVRVSFFIVMIAALFIGVKMNAKKVDAEEDDDSPIYTQYVAEVISAFLKEVYKKYGFTCGASGGEMPYDVEEISVMLVANKIATVDQARELEVNLTERFAQIINEHEKIRPFLREYPFPPGRACVSISFRDSKKTLSSSTTNDVKYVLHVKNRIYYQARNPENPYIYKDIKDEPYEEARKIVQSNMTKNDSQKPKII